MIYVMWFRRNPGWNPNKSPLVSIVKLKRSSAIITSCSKKNVIYTRYINDICMLYTLYTLCFPRYPRYMRYTRYIRYTCYIHCLRIAMLYTLHTLYTPYMLMPHLLLCNVDSIYLFMYAIRTMSTIYVMLPEHNICADHTTYAKQVNCNTYDPFQ